MVFVILLQPLAFAIAYPSSSKISVLPAGELMDIHPLVKGDLQEEDDGGQAGVCYRGENVQYVHQWEKWSV